MMDAYGANDLNDALRLATGIMVEQWETNRTNYEALGLGGRWRSQTSTIDSYTGIEVRQDAYVVLNAFARWDATEASFTYTF
jgi:outer membrane receptor for ferric coprogen and ferric-rhodotorulic acid